MVSAGAFRQPILPALSRKVYFETTAFSAQMPKNHQLQLAILCG